MPRAPLFDDGDRRLARTADRIVHTNPFLPERIALEREALGDAFDERDAEWNLAQPGAETPANVARLLERCETALERARRRIEDGARPEAADRELYEDLVWLVVYQRHRAGFDRTVSDALGGREPPPIAELHARFRADATRLLGRVSARRPAELDHVFAIFFQIRRAFRQILEWIVGVSEPAVRLRAQVWQSIFTHDLARYRDVLFERMTDYTTLVTGPSGTGKELVARAIGLSRYIPFDARAGAFTQDFAGSFQSLDLSALSPTLIESELFGHARGSFTGAVADRVGWLESCPPSGSVFLDEIGELDPAIQVKLLRVLESRTFSRLGDTRARRFSGKVIAATNRDLGLEMAAGRFRTDLYYRLCADVVVTPSLAERIHGDPAELEHLVRFLATRAVGEQAAGPVASEVLEWIEGHLGDDYPWPGNVRELEQCVRNVLIRRDYRPARAAGRPGDPVEDLLRGIRAGDLAAEEVLSRYCTLVYARIGSYEGAARRLGLDRRTVRAKVDAAWLAALRHGVGDAGGVP